MRFYKPGNTQYQSQFAPLDLNFIQKIGAAKDAQSYEVDDLLDKADQLKIDAGMFSKKEEVDKYNQWLKENVTSTRDQLLNQEITEEEAARNISKINSVLTTSEAVKFFNADSKLTAELRAGIVAGKYNKGISTNFNYLDPNNPQITPISYTEGLGALAEAGNIQVPGDFLKDHKDWYDNINTTQLGNIIASNKYKVISDPKLGLILADQDGNKVTKGQFKDALRPYAESYAKENFQNTSLGSVDYMRRTGKNEEDYANRLLDSYSGYFKLDEDTRNTTYRPLGDSVTSAATLNAPYSVPTINMAPVDQNWGIEEGDFKKLTPLGMYDLITIPSSLFMVDELKDAAGKITKRDAQPYELDELPKKYLESWAMNNPNWQHVYKNYMGPNNPNNIKIPESTLKAMYKAFYPDMEEYNKDIVRTANTATQINYRTDAEINDAAKRNTAEANYLRQSRRVWEIYAGNKPSATISDVLINAGNSRIWSVTDKKFLNTEDRDNLNKEHGTTNVPALGQTTAENLLNVLTSDETFKNAVTFSTPDGNQYMIEDRTFGLYNSGEKSVNTFYRKGKMALGRPVEAPWDDVSNITYKIGKNNQVTLLTESGSPVKIKGKEIAPFANMSNMLYQLSIENNPYLKQSLHPNAAKSKPVAKKAANPAAGKK